MMSYCKNEQKGNQKAAGFGLQSRKEDWIRSVQGPTLGPDERCHKPRSFIPGKRHCGTSTKKLFFQSSSTCALRCLNGSERGGLCETRHTQCRKEEGVYGSYAAVAPRGIPLNYMLVILIVGRLLLALVAVGGIL